MKKFKRIGLAVCAAALLCALAPVYGVAAEDNEINTLRDAVAVGVLTNPEYGIVANNRRATDEELAQAKALYLPSIDFRGDTGYEYTDDPGTRGGADGDDEESLWRYDAGVTLTQMLFDGFEAKYEVERQRNRVLSASHRVRETAEFVGLDIVESYLEVLRQRKVLDIARENVAQHITILEQIEEASEAGRSTQADVEQAKARLASAKAQESDVRQALRLAESSFKREVGDLPGDLALPVIPMDMLSADVEAEVKRALAQSPTLDINNADISVAESEWQGTGSTLYPQLDLQLNARHGEDMNGVEGEDTSASALLVMNWNLYRGGADVARQREHVYRHAEAKERRVDSSRAVEENVRQTWARMVSAGERAREFASQAAANEQVVVAYMDQFTLDRRTLLDVLDAQNELFVSRSNTVNNEFLEMFAVYRLLAMRGDLLPALNVSYPQEIDPTDNYQ